MTIFLVLAGIAPKATANARQPPGILSGKEQANLAAAGAPSGIPRISWPQPLACARIRVPVLIFRPCRMPEARATAAAECLDITPEPPIFEAFPALAALACSLHYGQP